MSPLAVRVVELLLDHPQSAAWFAKKRPASGAQPG
jgi:hypothetical protein